MILANVGLPVLEVIWDAVFYKSMAFALSEPAQFSLQRIYPMPPLYPLALSLAHWPVDSYRWIEWLQSLINPAIYFTGVFALYRLARLFVSPGLSALACVLYAVHSASVYTLWSVSENLAAPLSMFTVYFGVKLLVEERPRLLDGAWLGLFGALSVLTRIQAIVFCGVLLAWLMLRYWRRGQNIAPLLLAYSVGFTLVMFAWVLLGYFSAHAQSPFYFDLALSGEMTGVASQWLAVWLGQLHGLWIDGGLLVMAFLFVHLLASWLLPERVPAREREAAWLFGVCLLVMVLFVSIYYVLRAPFEDWSISTRYLFYLNQMSFPLALCWLGRLQAFSWRERSVVLGCLAAVVLLLFAGLFFQGVWETLGDAKRFFTNAPGLDVMAQLRNEGPLTGGLLFVGVSLVLGAVWLFERRVGFALAAALMIYLQGSALDMAFHKRAMAEETLDARAIHAFCAQLEAGQWNETPIYCLEPFALLRPNLSYWVDRNSAPWPAEPPYPAPPYLLVTRDQFDRGRLVFEQDNLKAYLVEPEPAAPEPAGQVKE